MTNKEILINAIRKAEKNGYKEHLKMLPVLPTVASCANTLMNQIFWQRRHEIIFSHEFAKAYWGEKEELVRVIDMDFVDYEQAWMIHLKNMVVQKHRIKYLEKFLSKDK